MLKSKQGGSIGIVIAMKWYEPLTNTTVDILAARRAQSFELEWYVCPALPPQSMQREIGYQISTVVVHEDFNC
jgi:beta-glucosidase/6-phospho-beta-glucosidase/beta-galactosidase